MGAEQQVTHYVGDDCPGSHEIDQDEFIAREASDLVREQEARITELEEALHAAAAHGQHGLRLPEARVRCDSGDDYVDRPCTCWKAKVKAALPSREALGLFAPPSQEQDGGGQ